MADPLTLAAIGGVVLTEGIKFLYGQAGEVLKRWRQRRDQGANLAAGSKPDQSEPIVVRTPPILEGELSNPVIHFDRVASLEEQLRELRRSLNDYVDGTEEIDPGNRALLVKADTLRRLLEAVYGQRITLKGEARPPSGSPIVVGTVDVETLAGEAAGVIAGVITGGAEVHGRLSADRIEPGAKGYGVQADRIEG